MEKYFRPKEESAKERLKRLLSLSPDQQRPNVAQLSDRLMALNSRLEKALSVIQKSPKDRERLLLPLFDSSDIQKLIDGELEISSEWVHSYLKKLRKIANLHIQTTNALPLMTDVCEEKFFLETGFGVTDNFLLTCLYQYIYNSGNDRFTIALDLIAKAQQSGNTDFTKLDILAQKRAVHHQVFMVFLEIYGQIKHYNRDKKGRQNEEVVYSDFCHDLAKHVLLDPTEFKKLSHASAVSLFCLNNPSFARDLWLFTDQMHPEVVPLVQEHIARCGYICSRDIAWASNDSSILPRLENLESQIKLLCNTRQTQLAPNDNQYGLISIEIKNTKLVRAKYVIDDEDIEILWKLDSDEVSINSWSLIDPADQSLAYLFAPVGELITQQARITSLYPQGSSIQKPVFKTRGDMPGLSKKHRNLENNRQAHIEFSEEGSSTGITVTRSSRFEKSLLALDSTYQKLVTSFLNQLTVAPHMKVNLRKLKNPGRHGHGGTHRISHGKLRIFMHIVPSDNGHTTFELDAVHLRQNVAYDKS